MKLEIYIKWTVEDIYCVLGEYNPQDRDLLTIQDLAEILKSIKDNHNPSYGITWNTIRFYVDKTLEKKHQDNRV